MSFHVPENAIPGVIIKATGARSSGAPTVAVSGWPSGWTAFPKIASVVRASTVIGHLELTAYSGGNLSISGGAEGGADFALLINDVLELRPTKTLFTEFQTAITALMPISGITSARPTVTTVGFPYYDTSLGKPVWWNGSAWKDATGATV